MDIQLPDSALALADAMGFDRDVELIGDVGLDLHGALQLARQIHIVLTDIANNFGERPEEAAASSILAVGGMIHDVHLLAVEAGLIDDPDDIPPNPLHAALEHAPRNRQERRREERLTRRLHGGRHE